MMMVWLLNGIYRHTTRTRDALAALPEKTSLPMCEIIQPYGGVEAGAQPCTTTSDVGAEVRLSGGQGRPQLETSRTPCP